LGYFAFLILRIKEEIDSRVEFDTSSLMCARNIIRRDAILLCEGTHVASSLCGKGIHMVSRTLVRMIIVICVTMSAKIVKAICALNAVYGNLPSLAIRGRNQLYFYTDFACRICPGCFILTFLSATRI
jgi:hypothetical protein